MADGFVVGDFRPLGRANVVLRMNERVADKAHVGHYAHKLFGRHGGPDVPIYLGIVNLLRVSVSKLHAFGETWDREGGKYHEGRSENGS